MLGLLTGTAIPLLTNVVKGWLGIKEKKADAEIALKQTEALAKANVSAEIAKAEAEKVKAQCNADITRMNAVVAMNKVKTGIKWIDASINLIRALFGFGAVIIFLMSAVNLWLNGSPLLEQDAFTEAFFIVVGYFFAERSAKKVFSAR